MRPSPRPVRGRGYLLLIRIVSILLSLTFTALMLGTVLLAFPGTLAFDLPELGEEGGVSYEDGVLLLRSALNITNRGYAIPGLGSPLTHDLNDLSFTVRAVVADSIVVADYASPPVDIPVGEERTIALDIPIDLAALVGLAFIVLEPANVSFSLGVGGSTTRGLVDFGASVTIEQRFDALVQFEVDVANATVSDVMGSWELTVPYVVGTPDFLSGNASLGVTLRNATGGRVGVANETIPLGTDWGGNFTFVLDQEQAQDLLAGPQDLTLELEVELPGGLRFAVTRPLDWEGG